MSNILHKRMDIAFAEIEKLRGTSTATSSAQSPNQAKPLTLETLEEARKAMEAIGPLTPDIQLMKSDFLPPGTAICSPDVFETLTKGLEKAGVNPRVNHNPPWAGYMSYTGA